MGFFIDRGAEVPVRLQLLAILRAGPRGWNEMLRAYVVHLRMRRDPAYANWVRIQRWEASQRAREALQARAAGMSSEKALQHAMRWRN